ncbi:CPSF A subunit region-domain-containing protein [Cerioporus squamosus]|nr:CPSF A subunit region-domain-containing protein [Cerioporus squamosus]
MRVVGTFHPSSSVSRSVKCRLTPDAEHLVVAKTDKLEVHSLQPDGMKRECIIDMWGRVVGLQVIPAKEPGRSRILAMTDHPDPKLVVMAFGYGEDGVASLTPKSSLSLADRSARPAEFVTDVQVDPTGKIAVACCFTGKLKVVPLKNGELGNAFDVSLPELNLLAFTFLHTKEDKQHTLGLLHLNHRRQIQLLCRDVDLKEFELSPAHSNLIITTLLSDRAFPSLDPPPLLVPIPPYPHGNAEEGTDPELADHRGGVLVLGGKKIVFYENSTNFQQGTRKDKQRRLSKRLASDKQADVTKAREKEQERDSRKVKPRASVKWPWGPVTAWSVVDDACRKVLLGDAFGRLAMLAFDDVKMCLTVIPLGETSPAACLSYLSSQVLYLGSHFGDSQLLRIHPSPIANAASDTLPIPKGITTISPAVLASSDKGKGRASGEDSPEDQSGRVVNAKGTFLEVLQTYDNIAPIMDAVLEDIDGSGQPQVITCSGARNTGSLRVIRSEADFQETARLQGLSGISDIWPVKSHSDDPIHSHLVMSTLRETLVFSFADEETISLLDPSFTGFVTNVPTLALGNIPRRQPSADGKSSYIDSPLVVQITSEGAHLLEYDPALGTFSRTDGGWYPKQAGATFEGREVVAAAMNASQFVVGLDRGRLALLNLGQDGVLQLLKTRDFSDDICAISCRPLDSTKNFTTLIAVSFWSNRVAILSVGPNADVLSTVCETTLPALPRSVLLHNFGKGAGPGSPDFHLHLLAGLADGTLVTYAVRDKELHDRKQSSLGNAPASLSVCDVDGRTVVFASGARANVLFWDKQRVRPSPTSLKDVVKGASLNAAAFPSCLVIATSSALLIGRIRGVDKMQIRTIPLGLDNPRKIAYHAGQEVVGVACTRTAPGRIGDLEEVTGSFKLLDAHSFRELQQFNCSAEEEPSSVLALPGAGSGKSPAFVLGTVTIRPEEREPTRGRIVLLSVASLEGTNTRSLDVLAMEDVRGCVYAIARLSDDLIAAAINTSVVLYRIRENDSAELSPLTLEKVTEWNHSHFLTNLVYDGQYILVGDAISSVAALVWSEERGRLEAAGRDYGPLWPVSIESTGNGIIGANSDCNLFSFKVQPAPPLPGRNVRVILEKDGVYHVDDVVNKFLRGALSSADVSDAQAVKASHVFFTSTGRIGAIMDIDDSVSLHMTALQRNMAKKIQGPGGVNHTKYRTPASPRGHTDAEASYGFLDGDFLETFLSHAELDDFMEGDVEAERITLPIDQVKDVLVQMQSLH